MEIFESAKSIAKNDLNVCVCLSVSVCAFSLVIENMSDGACDELFVVGGRGKGKGRGERGEKKKQMRRIIPSFIPCSMRIAFFPSSTLDLSFALALPLSSFQVVVCL